MVVLYAIDWESIYSSCVTDRVFDEDALYDLLMFLRSMRERIVRNGLVCLDRPNNATRGLVELLSLLQQEDAEDGSRRIAVWDKLRDELREFQRLYARSEYCIRVDCDAGVRSYVETQRILNAYLKATRLNRKVWRYPAVVISCSPDLPSAEDGFRKVSLEAYDSCEEEKLRRRWADGCAIANDDKDGLNQIAAAISIAAGASEDGLIAFFDPHWAGQILVNPPDAAWKASTQHWFRAVFCNPYVRDVRFISSGTLELKRRYAFGAFVKLLLSACDQRKETVSVNIGLREETEKAKGRKAFHNRYIKAGRFVVEIPNGLDIVARDNSVRAFDCSLLGDGGSVLKELANPRGSLSLSRSDVRAMIADHEEFMFDRVGGETFQFRVEDRKLVRCDEEAF